MQLSITAVDVAILIGYVIGTRIFFGWYFARKTRGQGSESYFLAGRSMRWPVIGMSFYVANMSGSSFVALPASGFNDGIAAYHYEWAPALLLIFFVAFVLPLYLKAKVYTASEFFERRYGRSSRFAFSGFQLVTTLLVDAAATLYAGAIIMRSVFPDIPLVVTIASTALIAGVYITFGGLGAVVINDVLQATLIFFEGSLILALAL